LFDTTTALSLVSFAQDMLLFSCARDAMFEVSFEINLNCGVLHSFVCLLSKLTNHLPFPFSSITVPPTGERRRFL
jgi:hypothetical protein